jgi:DNA-3-methyladenine glycosylase I
MAEKNLVRCPWVPKNDALYTEYHDKEWGVPVYDDQKIFEFLTLEIFQAGLSWRTVLYKRENFRKAFLNFDVKKVSEFSEKEVVGHRKRNYCKI